MNYDKGFTLVEVVVAVAVVAIVSTSLFQMFVTSSYVNKDAQIMDLANVVTVQQAETFKANPSGYSPGNEYHYYKADGTFMEDSSLVSIPNGAAFQVASDLEVTNSQANQAAYYPNFVGTIDLSQSSTDLDVKMTNISTTYEIDVAPAGTGQYTTLPILNSNVINNSLPIEVDFPTGGTSPRTINVTNDSAANAGFYVFNANNQNVIINAVEGSAQGSSSVVYAPTSSTTTNSTDTEYTLNLTVSKLNQGVWEEINQIKYWDNPVDPNNPANNAIHKYIPN
ncbi:MAG: prepilin-type N-terminal cleavage/methylation domain-containing protein [Desulfosporosinus sp.]|nr:prepilin-type N-terminal cleavage/methylation domain-containing protein [Desulfosporosinus sp.]